MRTRSTLSRLDDLLLVGVVTIVAAWIMFHLIAGLVGFVLFLVKVVIVAAVAGVAFRAVSHRHRRELDDRPRRRLPR